MQPCPISRRRRVAALDAIASAARQEVLSELAEGPATVKELSARLARSRQALHFHVGVLSRAGLVEVAGERGAGRDRERVYRRSPGATDLRARARRLDPRERASAARAVQSMLRVAQREVVRALHERKLDEGTAPLAIRAKARLDAESLARTRQLLQEIMQLFRAAKGKNQERRMIALTVVLSPARESVAARPAKTGRKENSP